MNSVTPYVTSGAEKSTIKQNEVDMQLQQRRRVSYLKRYETIFIMKLV
jgi:hypothetical protein